MQMHNAKPSVFVALVHETLKLGAFDSRGDLAEAVKRRAARLHLRYDTALVEDALDQVARVRGRLTRDSTGVRLGTDAISPSSDARAVEPASRKLPPITRAQAAQLVAELLARVNGSER